MEFVTKEDLHVFCEAFVGFGCETSDHLIDVALFITTSLDKLRLLFGMKAGASMLVTAIILALIRVKCTVDGINIRLGPFDLDDTLEFLIVYLVCILMTILLGSHFWFTIAVCYNMRCENYGNLSATLLLLLVYKLYEPKPPGLLSRALIFVGLQSAPSPVLETIQVAMGLGIMLLGIIELRSLP